MGVQLTKEMIAGAQDSEQKYGIPASITLGQIMLESGGSNKGGLSGLAYKYNNLFGVTAGSSWKGKTTTMSNKAGTDTKTYRVYDSVQDSITDHSKVLLNERYTKYTGKAQTVEEYADGIAKGGYAEDPNYSSKLKSIIKSNNLTAYDGNSWQGKSGKLTSSDVQNVSSVSNTSEKETDLHWWGDIVVLVITILLIILGIVFFLTAFNGLSKIPVIGKAKQLKKAVGK